MKRAVWLILNENFTLTLDGEIKDEKVTDKKFSPGSDIWTNELPQLGFEDEKVQNDYDELICIHESCSLDYFEQRFFNNHRW